mmetsp:Transcript_26406/g.84581  ORF Transcript_26406/g.84581 Transcript_26406/m.84581 type:complete len:385 (-) Transcript_26406:112-1266(-)
MSLTLPKAAPLASATRPCAARGTTAARVLPVARAGRAGALSGMGSVACISSGSALGRARGDTSERRGRHHLRVLSLDAAQPFDYESRKLQELKVQREKLGKLTIGLVGFGNFGQFLAKRFVKQGHTVIATSRTDYHDVAGEMGVGYFQNSDDFCEEHPEVVILCTSILSTEKVLLNLPLQRLRRNTLFVDVLSVKEFPKKLFTQALPSEFDILCLHPMFGPDSGAGSWDMLNLVYDKVRIGGEPGRAERVDAFLDIWAKEGCRMVEMSCEEHDKRAASSQFITHTVGRVLGNMNLGDTSINTKGYESLLNLVNNTANDSFDLYYGLFMYNENATQELERLEHAFDEVGAMIRTSKGRPVGPREGVESLPSQAGPENGPGGGGVG